MALTGDPYERRIASRLYHDVEAEWRSPWQFSIVGGISNLADEDPPLIFSGMANTDPATYRLLGRTYYFRLKWQG